MSAHLTWMIIRNNNAYMMKKRNIRKPFSTEPNNLNNLSSFRYNGLIHKKSVGVIAAPDNKGFTVVYKKAKESVSILEYNSSKLYMLVLPWTKIVITLLSRSSTLLNALEI